MAAVAEDNTSERDPRQLLPAFQHIDPVEIQARIERASRAMATVEPDPDEPSCGAEFIDLIAELESLQNAAAALQSVAVRAFARTHVAHRIAKGDADPERLERDVAAQIGSACRVSPTEGRTRLRAARDLREGLDHVHELFVTGQLTDFRVRVVVTATADLDAVERARVDQLLAAHDLRGMGTGTLRDLARSLAARVAPDKFRARCATARTHRRVTLRPAADGMTDLIAHLPAEQGAACLSALHQAFHRASVDPAPMTRSRGQFMADTLVERLTGQTTADAVDVEVQVLVPVEVLVDPDSPLPVEIPGHGPVPADLLATVTGRTTWRRLVTRQGIVIGGTSTRRCFTGLLDVLVRARERHRCSEPYCDAPMRERDHIHRYADGGATDFANARGVCAFHNRTREMPGWRVDRTPDGVVTTTPTGHTYLNPRLAVTNELSRLP